MPEAEFTRQATRDAIEDPKAKEIYARGMEAWPEKGRAIVVLAADWCPHCHESLKANNYPTKTENGIPIIWMNSAYREVMDRFLNIPGVERGAPGIAVGGTEITGFPTAIEIVNGRAVSVLAVPLKEPGAFNEIGDRLAAIDEANAKTQAAAALKDNQGTGNTVPNRPQTLNDIFFSR